MGWKIGAPCLKLNNVGMKSKSCGSFGGVAEEALEERKGRDPDIDRTRSHLNYQEGYRTAAELQEYSRQHIAQLRDAKGRQLRRDAVVMCVTILKPPAAFMATLSDTEQQRFLADANEILAEIVGKENIKARADHYDEIGAHSHVFWEPMTKDGRLCAKEVHNLKFFGRVNRELPEKLREKGWDIADCECYDAAKEEYEFEQKKSGRSSMAYKLEAEQAKQQLEVEISELQEQAATMRDVVQQAYKAAEAAKSRVEAIQAMERDIADLEHISPQKTLTGAIKGVSVKQVEQLKAAAVEGNAAKRELERVKAENVRLRGQIPSVRERLQETREQEKLRQENRVLRERVRRLERALDFLCERLPEPLQPLIGKVKELLEGREATERRIKRPRVNREYDGPTL